MIQTKNEVQNNLDNQDNSAKPKRKKSTKLKITQRDVDIFTFLDRVGYANIEQIAQSFGNQHTKLAILTRLYALKNFNYIKIISTQNGNYYTLLKRAGNKNTLITSIKLDQLMHHDYLINLFNQLQQHDISHEILSEREVIAKYKIVGKSGKIPDMIVNNWIIEYERTNKSTTDCLAMISYWLYDQNRHICLIYETEEIRNRYAKIVENNQQIQLVTSTNLQKIIKIISAKPKENENDNVQLSKDQKMIIQHESQEFTNEISPIAEPKSNTKSNIFGHFDLEAWLAKN